MHDDQLWIFGYGSLMWDPGFACAERAVATLYGYQRGFLMRSIHHRGTPEHPGLVLALDAARGAACTGLALRVTPGTQAQALRDLRARELVSYAYRETRLPVHLTDGRVVEAVTYVIDRAHPQYTGPLPLPEQARIIATARGRRGDNSEYLFNTHAHLQKLGIEDIEIARLARQVRTLQAGRSGPS